MGLIGQNGSGKTTTFRLILDFLVKEKGKVYWKEQNLSKVNYNEIGFLPEERGLYQKETIESQLYFFAQLHGKAKKEIDPIWKNLRLRENVKIR
jgi:ABC-2 type transport system ATP-binding protein